MLETVIRKVKEPRILKILGSALGIVVAAGVAVLLYNELDEDLETEALPSGEGQDFETEEE